MHRSINRPTDMFRNSITKAGKNGASPIATMRRTLMKTGLERPQVEHSKVTSRSQPSKWSTASIVNGTKGEQVFPKGTFFKTASKELPKAVGALIAISSIMFAWPYVMYKGSDYFHSVPEGSTAAVTKVDGEMTAYIPQTYAHRDISSDDDE